MPGAFSMVTLPLSIYKEVVAEIMRWNELLKEYGKTAIDNPRPKPLA